jgi:hypothetical protein
MTPALQPRPRLSGGRISSRTSTDRLYRARDAFRSALSAPSGAAAAADVRLWLAWSDVEHELGRRQGTGGFFEARAVLQQAASQPSRRLAPSPPLLDSLAVLHLQHGMEREARACIRAHMALWPDRACAAQVHLVLDRERKWRRQLTAGGGGGG